MEFFFIILLVIAALVAVVWYVTRSNNERPQQSSFRKVEKISFRVDQERTRHNKRTIRIVGNYWEGMTSKAVILIHMMPATKESWTLLANALNEQGYHVLAIDLRGHGESTERLKPSDMSTDRLDYHRFSDKQHKRSIIDVIGAQNWLRSRGIKTRNIYVGGASIGANLAIKYISLTDGAPGGFMLSPGLDYHGVNIEALLDAMNKKIRLLFISADDDQYSAQTVRKLHTQHPDLIYERVYFSGGHGTDLFQAHDALIDEIIKFIDQRNGFDPNYKPKPIKKEY